MTLTGLDWAIVGGVILLIVWGAARTRVHTRSVSAFLAAERCGGRYLIAVSDHIAMLGVITLVASFEQGYEIGYATAWWPLMEGPAMIVMALSGWVIYRFRQTRAMTLAQFFEMRYSRSFRVFAGVVAFLAGILNFAIFPSVGARFFMALCGFPAMIPLGGMEIPVYPLTVFSLVGVSMALLLMGGQLAVMVTDFLQGVVCNVTFIVLCLFVLISFGWDRISEVLLAAPAGHSLIDPFDLGKEKHFDFWYYAIGVVVMFYCAKGWQGTQGYNCSAKNAHEAKMANILSLWRYRVLLLVVVIMPIAVHTLLSHPDFSAEAARVHSAMRAIDAPSPEVKAALENQLRTPLAMSVMLPAGLLGLACAAMLGAFISTHDSYLHSWGSILVQDVILPLRKKPLSPRRHLLLLRLAVVGVGIFICFVSLVFQHTQFIAMLCALTASVFVGGAGAVIIGGLYWSRGTTPAAWAAMIVGIVASTAGIVIKQVDPHFFLTGQEMTFAAMALAAGTYVAVSLLGPRSEHNMDRLLHRGKYAIEGESSLSYRDARTIWEKLGFSREFTGGDRWVAGITLAWPLAWTIIFVVVTVYNLMVDVPATSWLSYWHGWTWFILVCSGVLTIWFAIGGVADLRDLFARLRGRVVDPNDDGVVRE